MTGIDALIEQARDLADEWEMPRPRSKKQAAMLLCGVQIGRNQMRKTALHVLVDNTAIDRQLGILNYD